jgi:tetratricopeptide (TPR) repeat protein
LFFDIGNRYYDLGNKQEAINYYKLAIEKNPNNPTYLTNLGIKSKK